GGRIHLPRMVVELEVEVGVALPDELSGPRLIEEPEVRVAGRPAVRARHDHRAFRWELVRLRLLVARGGIRATARTVRAAGVAGVVAARRGVVPAGSVERRRLSAV